MPELPEALAGTTPAHRTLLCLRDIQRPVNENDRLRMSGLRAVYEAPSQRRILLRQALTILKKNLSMVYPEHLFVFFRSGPGSCLFSLPLLTNRIRFTSSTGS